MIYLSSQALISAIGQHNLRMRVVLRSTTGIDYGNYLLKPPLTPTELMHNGTLLGVHMASTWNAKE